MNMNNRCKLKRRMGEHIDFCASSAIIESGYPKRWRRHSCSDEFLAVAKTLHRFGISDRTGAAIVSEALQNVAIAHKVSHNREQNNRALCSLRKFTRGFSIINDVYRKSLCAYVIQDQNKNIGNLCCTAFALISRFLALSVRWSERRHMQCYKKKWVVWGFLITMLANDRTHIR